MLPLITKMNKLPEKTKMEKSFFSLEANKSNKLTRIFQLLFGIVCAGVAIVWLSLNLEALKLNGSLIITILFLLGFAYYQVNSGLGRAEKFIEFSQSVIRLKKNSILPAREITAPEIEKIEVYPVNVVFLMKGGKKVILRFGTTFTDIIEPVKKALEGFCTKNNLMLEYMKEEC